MILRKKSNDTDEVIEATEKYEKSLYLNSEPIPNRITSNAMRLSVGFSLIKMGENGYPGDL